MVNIAFGMVIKSQFINKMQIFSKFKELVFHYIEVANIAQEIHPQPFI